MNQQNESNDESSSDNNSIFQQKKPINKNVIQYKRTQINYNSLSDRGIRMNEDEKEKDSNKQININ